VQEVEVEELGASCLKMEEEEEEASLA